MKIVGVVVINTLLFSTVIRDIVWRMLRDGGEYIWGGYGSYGVTWF